MHGRLILESTYSNKSSWGQPNCRPILHHFNLWLGISSCPQRHTNVAHSSSGIHTHTHPAPHSSDSHTRCIITVGCATSSAWVHDYFCLSGPGKKAVENKIESTRERCVDGGGYSARSANRITSSQLTVCQGSKVTKGPDDRLGLV